MNKTQLSVVGILGLLSVIAFWAFAQEQKTIIIEQKPVEEAAPVARPQPPEPPPLQKIMGEMRAEALAEDAFIVVKDHGSSQTVMLYSVNETGGMALVHKAKFMYNEPPAPDTKPIALKNTTTVEGKIDLRRLSLDSFIVIKDHGWGQTSLSYKIDPTKRIVLLNRQSFLY